MNEIIPCKDCMIELINAGVEEVVVTEMVYYSDKAKIMVDLDLIRVRPYLLPPPPTFPFRPLRFGECPVS
jgi:deoxycytidylate deaminase